MRTQFLSILTLTAGLFACSSGTIGVVAPVNQSTGYIHVDEQIPKAVTTISTAVDMKADARFILVYATPYPYFRDQIRELRLSPEVVGDDDLARHIVKANLQDEFRYINNDIDLNRLYRKYQPFLVVRTFSEPRADGPRRVLTVLNPKDLSIVFRAETPMTLGYANRTDQKMNIPLINSFAEWARANGA